VKTTVILLALFCFASSLFASEEDPNDGKIEIVYPAEKLAPYKLRRADWGFLFGLSGEQIVPTKFRSRIDNSSYAELFGTSPMQAGQLELGLKYNFMLGSLGASVLYGNGGVHDGRIGDGRTLNVTKKGLHLTYTMDNLFNEPYVAPYGGVQFASWEWTEFADTALTKETGSTSLTGGLTVGVLLQIDWLMPGEALNARNSSGIENTFLDLYVSQYNASEAKEDQNLQTDMNYGFGLKVEY
jgi:hypothetical protein